MGAVDDGIEKIAVAEMSPFVMKQGGEYVGFDIDLLSEIAKRAEFDYEVNGMEFEEILPSVKSGKSSLGMAGITITSDREGIVDFSHHYLDSGLRILVNSGSVSNMSIASQFIVKMSKPIFWLVAFIFIFGNILWISERGEQAINDDYFPGVFEGMWLVITTMTTVGYGDYAPKRWSGRGVALMIMIVGISYFGWAVAELSNILDKANYVAEISTVDDLKGKRVATVGGTTSFHYLTNRDIKLTPENNLDKAILRLYAGKVDAVVFDEPALLYMLSQQKDNDFRLSGGKLNSECFGIAVEEGNPLRERINQAILEMKEDGTYSEICQKWFNK
jgi:ABC-type amino acid transport substrate-binding protein